MAQKRKVSWIGGAATFVVLYGAYLLFVSTLTKPELIAGIFVTAIATVASGVFGTIGLVRFKPTPGELAQAWRIPLQAITGTWAVMRALARQLFTKAGPQSQMIAVPFEVGDDDAHSAGRRALAVTYTTITPNSVVLGILHKQALLLYHQIAPADVPQLTINLGARP